MSDLQLFGLGLPKSGTTSIARIFSKHYRVAHEGGVEFLPSIIAYLNQEISTADMSAQLQKRSTTLNVNVDSASFLGHFPHVLEPLFPNARYVLTIRHCADWLYSILNHVATRSLYTSNTIWHQYRICRFGKVSPSDFPPEEKMLTQRRLFPIKNLLAYWSNMNKQIIATAPQNKLLVLRTDGLNSSLEAIADFCKVPRSSLQESHVNKAPGYWGELHKLSPDYIHTQCTLHCSELMKAYFGEDWWNKRRYWQ